MAGAQPTAAAGSSGVAGGSGGGSTGTVVVVVDVVVEGAGSGAVVGGVVVDDVVGGASPGATWLGEQSWSAAGVPWCWGLWWAPASPGSGPGEGALVARGSAPGTGPGLVAPAGVPERSVRTIRVWDRWAGPAQAAAARVTAVAGESAPWAEGRSPAGARPPGLVHVGQVQHDAHVLVGVVVAADRLAAGVGVAEVGVAVAQVPGRAVGGVEDVVRVAAAVAVAVDAYDFQVDGMNCIGPTARS